MDLVVAGDKHLKVVVSSVVAVNPYVIRITCYTYNPDTNVSEETPKDYEIAVGITEFTSEGEKGNVDVDLVKLQHILSEKIVQSQNAANLALVVDNANMEWDIVLNQPMTEEKEDNKEGLSLAYGGEQDSNGTTTS
jgi:hypothetical protein